MQTHQNCKSTMICDYFNFLLVSMQNYDAVLGAHTTFLRVFDPDKSLFFALYVLTKAPILGNVHVFGTKYAVKYCKFQKKNQYEDHCFIKREVLINIIKRTILTLRWFFLVAQCHALLINKTYYV